MMDEIFFAEFGGTVWIVRIKIVNITAKKKKHITLRAWIWLAVDIVQRDIAKNSFGRKESRFNMVFCHGRGKEEADICEYAEKCNEKIDCTTSDDVNSEKYPVYCAGFGRCMRDDGGIIMSKAVREMTREELIAEKAKQEEQCRVLANRCDMKERQIKEMQSHIDCLKAELEEVQMRKADLHTEPIKVADMLIDHSYSTGCLRQIAEHLLVYCNNAEVE